MLPLGLVVAGLSIFTPPLALAPAGAADWLQWLCTPKDGPVLVLLGLVLLAVGLGLAHGRRLRDASPEADP